MCNMEEWIFFFFLAFHVFWTRVDMKHRINIKFHFIRIVGRNKFNVLVIFVLEVERRDDV